MITSIQQSFNGGQMAPFLHNRADIDKFRSGLRDGTNFIPTPFGPLRRRPGFIYNRNVKNNANATRVLTFALGNNDGYVLEMGNGYIRFIRDRAIITDAGSAWADSTSYVASEVVSHNGAYYLCTQDHVSSDGGGAGTDEGAGDTEPGIGSGAPYTGPGDGYWYLLTTSGSAGIYEWPVPYASADIFDVQVAQVNDIMYLVHKDYPVLTLSRVDEDKFDVQLINWTWPPMRSANLDEAFTLNPSGVSGTITVQSSEDFFTSEMVGGFLEIGYERAADEWTARRDISSTGTSSALKIRGEFQFRTNGLWSGSIDVEISDTGAFAGEEETLRTFDGDQDENFVVTLDTGTDLKHVRINATITGGSGKRYASIEAIDPTVYGWVEITGYTSATQVTCAVGSQLYDSVATSFWSEGAFSDRRGHARTVTLHELRLVFGGTNTDRQTVWASQTDDFPNFETGTLDTDAYTYQIASTEQNEINWILSQRQLLIGTSGGEWVMDSGRDENVITPTNVRARRHSNYGSEYRQALAVDASTLFVRSGGERLSDFSYLFEQDGYSSGDLNLLSYDLTRGGIKQSVYQKKRDPFIWSAIDSDGSLACMAYNQKQGVTGWTPIKSPGNSGNDVIESVTVVGRSGDEAEVWAVVKRVINTFTVRYIERLDSDGFDKQEDAIHYNEQEGTVADTGTNLEDLVFLDSAYTASGGDLTDNGDGTFTIAGLDHLVGEAVICFADGARNGATHTVNVSGEITIEASSLTKATCGLPYTSTLRTLPLFNQLQTGTTRGRETSVKKAVVIVHRSGLFTIKGYDDPNGAQEASLRSTDVDEGDPTPLRDGEFEFSIECRNTLDPSVLIESDEPLPLTIEALILKYEVHGD